MKHVIFWLKTVGLFICVVMALTFGLLLPSQAQEPSYDQPWAWTASGENENDRLGGKVALAGDVNNDGFSDLIVSATGHDNNRGKVYVYRGSTSGFEDTPIFTATGVFQNSEFGISVANAGDVNGDNFDDIIVGSYGTAYVYFGSSAGVSTFWWLSTGDGTGSFGESVAGAGDVNGDGYNDIIVAAENYDNDRGKVYVYHGSATGLTTPSFTALGENMGDYFGEAIDGIGDVNNDGYDDIAGEPVKRIRYISITGLQLD